MRQLYLLMLFFSFLTWHVSVAATTVQTDDTPYCLQYTWLGPEYDQTSTVNISCDDYVGVPCIEPFIITTDGSEPNVTYMWENYNHTIIGCPLRDGFTCIKYTFTYNNALMNSSHFCGKMIEDQETPITTGCYTVETNAHTIESCGCQTRAGHDPCNSSTTNTNFLSLTLVSLMALFYNKIC